MGNLFRCGTGKRIDKLYIRRIPLYTSTVSITFTDDYNRTRKKNVCYFRLPDGVKKIIMGRVDVINGTVILYGTDSLGLEREIEAFLSNDNNVTVDVSTYTNVYFYSEVVGAAGGETPTTVGTSYIGDVTLEF